MPLPTLANTLAVSTPAFIRKLDRKSYWGEGTDDMQPRIESALAAIFPDEQKQHSLYRITNDDDLRRVALALNSRRSSKTEKICLLGVSEQELTEAGIVPVAENEHGTGCHHADKAHFNTHPTKEQLRALIESLMRKGRDAANIAPGMMKEVLKAAEDEGCLRPSRFQYQSL